MSKKFYCNFCQKDVQPEIYENVDCDIYHCPDCNRPMYYENSTGCLMPDQFANLFFAVPNAIELPSSVYELKKAISVIETQIETLVTTASELLDKRDELADYLPESAKA